MRLLQRFILSELGEMEPRFANLNAWICGNRFTGVYFTDGVWKLPAYSSQELYQAFSPDFERFAFSSFETLMLSHLESGKFPAASWPLLKLYYSAYFASHAISRATGNGHIFADGNVASSINSYLAATEEPPVFTKGTYAVEVLEDGTDAILKIGPSPPGRGVHDSFWVYFVGLLDEMSNRSVADALPDATDFVRQLSNLKHCIKDHAGPGIWFSAIRNAINYRHEFECWMPMDKKAPALSLHFPKLVLDPDSIEMKLVERTNELQRMVDLSLYLSSLNHQIILTVLRRVSGSSGFARRWNRLLKAVSP